MFESNPKVAGKVENLERNQHFQRKELFLQGLRASPWAAAAEEQAALFLSIGRIRA